MLFLAKIRLRLARGLAALAVMLASGSVTIAVSAEKMISQQEAVKIYAAAAESDAGGNSPSARFAGGLAGLTGSPPEIVLSPVMAVDLWNRLRAQIFRVDIKSRDGVLVSAGEYVLIRRNKMYPLVPPVVPGVVKYPPPQLILTDIDRDGKIELVYCYNWGVGIPYSTAAVFYQNGEDLVSGDKLTYMSGGLSLQKQDEHTILVLLADKIQLGRFVHDKQGFHVSLKEGLSADIYRHIREK